MIRAFFSAITGALSGIWGYVIIVAGGAVAVLAILAGARSAGRDSERVKNAKQAIEIIKRQRQAAARSPSDRRGVADRMRDGSF